VWPARPETFRHFVFKRRAFAVVAGTGDGKEAAESGGVDSLSSSSAHRVLGLCGALFDLDLEQMLEGTSSEAIAVSMACLDEDAVDTFDTDDPQTALTCFRGGASLSFRAPRDLELVLVSAFSRELGLSFGSIDAATLEPKGEVVAVVSHAGHFSDWQFDNRERFVVQLAGTKRWKVARSSVRQPFSPATPHVFELDEREEQTKMARLQNPAFDWLPTGEEVASAEEITLRAGDLLYVPSGFWSCAESEEDSISLSVNLVSTHWFEFFGSSLSHFMMARPSASMGDAFRESISDASGDSGVAQVQARCANMLDGLRAALADLTALDMIPPALIISPRDLSVQLFSGPAMQQAQHASIERFVGALAEGSSVKLNPLAVIVREPLWRDEVDGVTTAPTEEADSSSSSEHSSDESMAGESGRSDDESSDGDDESEGLFAPSDDDITWVVHVNFGSPDASSLLRVEVVVCTSHESAVEAANVLACLEGQSVGSSVTIRELVDSGASLEVCKHVLGVLAYNGFVRPR
jgi:JmjC domain